MAPAQPQAAAADVDAIVIGAGPVGLFQVFQLGLHGIAAHVIDALPHPGGQCAELYPGKPIYDIPGIPRCTGRALVRRLQRQIAPFAPTLHLGQQALTLERAPSGRWRVGTSGALALQARAVFIAAGVGAFMPRTLAIDALAQHQGRQLHYHPRAARLPALAKGQHVTVHGGEEDAVAAALACADAGAASVTLLHRRDVFQAAPALLERLHAQRAAGRIRALAAQITGQETQRQRLTALRLQDPEGQPLRLPLDQLLVYLGIAPRLGPIAHWGLALERKQLVVDTARFQTSERGIYAVGDINTYPGKRKLLVCGFHEATLAAFDAAELITGAPVALQYTTTSTRLQQRLGLLNS
jgi:thioredoxin reductase (NADPH)